MYHGRGKQLPIMLGKPPLASPPGRAMRWEALPATQPSIIMGSYKPSPFQYVNIFVE
jgi:hypothetical protein